MIPRLCARLKQPMGALLGRGLGRGQGAVLMVLLGLAGAWGCASRAPDPAEGVPLEAPPLSDENRRFTRGALSAVEVHGASFAAVYETVESVFTDAGLTVAGRERDRLVFERPADRRERGAYGNWSGGEVKIRLRTELYQQGNGVILVLCRSFVVREAGTYSEDEQPLARRHVEEYKGLLDEVAGRLN